MKNVVKDCRYYYDIENSNILKDMLYKDALYYKIEKAKKQLKKLQEVHYMDRDDYRINDILSAIEFNQKLLKE